MDFWRSTWLFFRTQLARLARSRRVLACAIAALVPAALAWLVSSIDGGPPRLDVLGYITWYLVLPVLAPMLALILGSAVISEELDDRTISYPFTRPVPRSSLFVGRWLATASIACGLIALAVLATFLAARLAGSRPIEPELTLALATPVIVGTVAGTLAYSALFACLGVFLAHPMIVGIGYVFAIEVLIAFLPGKTRELAIQHHVQSFVHGSGSELWGKVNEGVVKAFEPGQEALITLAIAATAAVVFGAWAVSRRQYVLSA